MKTTKEPKPESITTPSDPLPEGVDQLVDASLIDPHPSNRKIFPEDSLVEMEASVREHGILQRPTIRPVPGTGRYQLVFGERRWRGATRVDPHYSLPVTVRPLSDRQTLELQKIENLQREDLDPIEEAIGLRQMVEEFGYTLEQLEARLGRKKSAIYGKLKLARLCPGGAKLLRAGSISESVALRIARIPEPRMQEKLVKEIASCWQVRDEGDRLSDREARRMIESEYMKELKGAPFDQKDPELLPVATLEGERISGGACTDCPFRSGNQPDFDPKAGRADVCLNPTCYHAKCEAQFKRRAEEHTTAGGTLAKGKIFDQYGQLKEGFVRGDRSCFEFSSDGRKTFDSVAKQLKIQPVLAFDPRTGETLRLFDSGEVRAEAKKQGLVKKKSPTDAKWEARRKREEETRKRDESIRHAQIIGLLDHIGLQCKPEREAMLLDFLKLSLRQQLSSYYVPHEQIAKRHQLQPAGKKQDWRGTLQTFAAGLSTWQSVLALQVEVMLAHHSPTDGDEDILTSSAKLFGFNHEKTAREALAAYNAKEALKAGKGKKGAAK